MDSGGTCCSFKWLVLFTKSRVVSPCSKSKLRTFLFFFYVLICKKHRSKFCWFFFICLIGHILLVRLTRGVTNYIYTTSVPMRRIQYKRWGNVSDGKLFMCQDWRADYTDNRVTVKFIVHRGSGRRDGGPSFSPNIKPNITQKYFLLANKLESNKYRVVLFWRCIFRVDTCYTQLSTHQTGTRTIKDGEKK
jgi:hypothetical protein